MDNPYGWLQSAIDQVPEFIQPVIVALAGAIPYFEAEGAAGLGIVAGINPLVAAIAGATGNILCVIAVVALSSRIRAGVISRGVDKSRAGAQRPVSIAVPLGVSAIGAVNATATSPTATQSDFRENDTVDPVEKPNRRAKGHAKLRRWIVKFGVPGASILAPIALPTMLTAAFFVASGVPKQWVILWQIVAIVLWTSLVAVAATGLKAAVGW